MPDRAELERLLKRVEGATGPDREIDWLLTFDGAEAPMEYTASIDAALGLVERCLPGWFWLVRAPEDDCRVPGKFFANLQSPDYRAEAYEAGGSFRVNHLAGSEGFAYAETPPLAILAALLRALIAQSEAVEPIAS